MAEAITFQSSAEAARALDVLTRDGTSVSTAVCSALVAAARNRMKSALRAEAEALAVDDNDLAEAAQVMRDVQAIRAW